MNTRYPSQSLVARRFRFSSRLPEGGVIRRGGWGTTDETSVPCQRRPASRFFLIPMFKRLIF